MVRIITDGTSDLSAQRAEELGVHVMPMRVFFGQESFVDGVDITREEFFARLTSSDELPTTSQLNPDDFLEVFQKYVGQGDEIVGIFLSTELSGTCQSACIARQIGQAAPADPARPVAYGHSNSPERVPVCVEALKEVLPQSQTPVMGSIGAVIGTHVGPGAVGVAYIAAE